MIKRITQAKLPVSWTNSQQRVFLDHAKWAKTTLAEEISKSFHPHRFIVYPGKGRFPMSKEIVALPLPDMMDEISSVK